MSQTMISLALVLLIGAAWGIPMQVTINQRQNECLYDTLEAGETVTLTAFVLSGSSLKATLSFDGPLISSSVNSGVELFKASESFRGGADGTISHSEVIDFEDFAPPEEEEDDDDAINVDEPPIDMNDPDATQKRKERRERQRQKFLEAKAKRDKRKLETQKKIRQEGDPVVYTTKAPAEGWYKMCVQATWYQVVVEMEMRKESELGGLDEAGNVLSYEEQKMKEEDSELDRDTASEEGIKDEDFRETRDKIKDLRRLLNEIQSMQQKERRRLAVHLAV